MADFPTSVFALREILNRVGQTYDSNHKTTIYAEDLQALGDEITALETFFRNPRYAVDDDVSVYEFTGAEIDLGTGGYCSVVQYICGEMCRTRVEIQIGTSPSLGTYPLVLHADELPIPIVTQPAGWTEPGNFGALNLADGSLKMFAPAYNNITGYGELILFFAHAGTAFTNFLLGTGAVPGLGAGDNYFGTFDTFMTNYDNM